jgi:flagellar biogenesis protein FliO
MKIVNKGLAVYLALSLLVLGVFTALAPLSAEAMLMPSDMSGSTVTADQRAADLEQIQAKLESKVVAQRLSDLGMTTQEVQDRMQSLSSEQLHQVAQNLDGVQMGGDLILILAIVGAVVLLLALIGGLGHH